MPLTSQQGGSSFSPEQLTTDHTGTSFTASNGNGTATASTLTLSIPGSTTATSWANVPKFIKNCVTDPTRFDYKVRISSTSGGNTDTWIQMGLRKSDGTDHFFMQANAGSGLVAAYYAGSHKWNSGSGIFTYGGDEWLRIIQRDGYVVYMTGIGSAADEVNWTLRYRTITEEYPSGHLDYSYITLHLYQGSGAAGTVSAQFANVSTTELL